jgi:hypothetical protein
VVGTVVGAEVGTEDMGEAVGCDVVGTEVGADVGMEDVGDAVG